MTEPICTGHLVCEVCGIREVFYSKHTAPAAARPRTVADERRDFGEKLAAKDREIDRLRHQIAALKDKVRR